MMLSGCGSGGGESTTGASKSKAVIGDNAARLADVEVYLQEKSEEWFHYYRDATRSVEFRNSDFFKRYGSQVAALVYPGSETIIINTEFLHSQPMSIVASTLVHEAAHIRGISSHKEVYQIQARMLEEIGESSFWVNYYRRMARSGL